MKHTFALSCLAAMAACGTALAENRITVDVNKVVAPAAEDLWGIFFEDIDLSLDGGVYAEMVRNRSFEDGDRLGAERRDVLLDDGARLFDADGCRNVHWNPSPRIVISAD